MDRITLKLIKYFMTIIGIVVLLAFICSSIFLSKLYLGTQYSQLKDAAQEIYNKLNSSVSGANISVNQYGTGAILIQNGSVTPLGGGMMGVMPFIRNVDFNSLKEKGKYANPSGKDFLYYRLKTDKGDIVVLQSNKYSSNYLNVVYAVLAGVFFLAIIISIPLISYFGRKFTRPILKLQKSSSEIALGNYDEDILVDTGDEIEELSKSLKAMASAIKRKNELQRDFIANVSHDFKTPLSVIRNYSEAISDGVVNGEDVREYSKEIMGEADRLNSLVMDVLQLSKFQGGAVYDLKMDYFEIEELLINCAGRLQPMADKKAASIVVSSEKAQIYGDYKYLYRVLYNFIDNAVKFSKTGSKVEVRAKKQSEGIKISVMDFGTGIEKDELENIWSKYHKHSESGGIGLGLAICSEILKMHGFEYGVTSQLGENTEFYFYVPESKFKLL